ncbi:MAG: hypothetical protein ACYDAR_11670 [Thermomicrobiales bacterium]
MSTTTVERQRGAGRFASRLRWSPSTMRAKTGVFLLLSLLALATVAVLFQVPYHHTVHVGAPGDAAHVRGFYDPEGKGTFTYRWTTGEAFVRLPQGVFPGEADIVLSGNRPGSAPPRVDLGLSSRAGSSVIRQSGTDFATYPVRLPSDGGALNPAASPDLSILPSDTAVPPKENRALGVAVEQVVVFTNPFRFGPVVPPVLALLLVLGMAVALALVLLSVAPPILPLVAAVYGPVLVASAYLALRRADDPGRQAAAVAGFTVAALVAALVVWRQTLIERPWVRGLARLDGRIVLGVALLIALGYALYASHRLFGRLYDDAYITLRYARNLADGKGLRFNPGAMPVEGYTNFLLTVILAGCAKIGLPLVLMAKVISIGAALGTVIATYWLTALVLPDAPGLLRAIPSLLLALCGWFAFYAAIGLETHLFALLVTLAVCLVLRGRWAWASILFAAAYLTRPEGLGLWAVTLAWLIWQAFIRPRIFRRAMSGNESIDAPVRFGDIARFALPFSLVAGVHELWRLVYYGEPLPNTFYDKVGSTAQQVRRGWDYVFNDFPPLQARVFILLIVLLMLLPSGAIANRAARYVALLVAAFTGYVVLVGGDFIGPRFLFHVFPLIVVLLVAALRSLARVPWYVVGFRSHRGEKTSVWNRSSSPLAALAVALVALWLLLPLMPPGTFLTERVGNTHMREVTGLTALGDYLKEHAPPGATLAIDAAGVVPFVSGLTTLDMLGLNDSHIAHTAIATGEGVAGHEKTDPAYILAQRPTYIAVGMSKLTTGGRPGRGLDLPGFDAQYVRVALVRMNASVVSPDLVLVLTPQTDVQAAIDNGFTYGLYQHR